MGVKNLREAEFAGSGSVWAILLGDQMQDPCAGHVGTTFPFHDWKVPKMRSCHKEKSHRLSLFPRGMHEWFTGFLRTWEKLSASSRRRLRLVIGDRDMEATVASSQRRK